LYLSDIHARVSGPRNRSATAAPRSAASPNYDPAWRLVVAKLEVGAMEEAVDEAAA